MTRYIGLFELVAAYRAEIKPSPALVIEPSRIELTNEQCLAMDEMAGLA